MVMRRLESFIGISGQHTKADFARAVVEGITYSLYDSIKLMRERDMRLTRLHLLEEALKVSFGYNCKPTFSIWKLRN